MKKTYFISLLILFAANVHAWTPDTIRYCDCGTNTYDTGDCQMPNLKYVAPCDERYGLEGTKYGKVTYDIEITDIGITTISLVNKELPFYFIEIKIITTLLDSIHLSSGVYIYDHYHYLAPLQLFATIDDSLMDFTVECNQNDIVVTINEIKMVLNDTTKDGMFSDFFNIYQGFNQWFYNAFVNDEESSRILNLIIYDEPNGIQDITRSSGSNEVVVCDNPFTDRLVFNNPAYMKDDAVLNIYNENMQVVHEEPIHKSEIKTV